MKFYCLAIFYFLTCLNRCNLQNEIARDYFLFDDYRVGLDFCLINGNRHFFYFEVSKQISRKIFQEFLSSVNDLILVDFVCFYEYIFNWFVFNLGAGCLNERDVPLSAVLRSSCGILYKKFYFNLGLNFKIYEEYSLKKYELSWFFKIRRKSNSRFRGFINGSFVFRSLFKSSSNFVFSRNPDNVLIDNCSFETSSNNKDFCGKNFNQNIFYSLYSNVKTWIAGDEKESKKFKDSSNDHSQEHNENVYLGELRDKEKLKTIIFNRLQNNCVWLFSRISSFISSGVEVITSNNNEKIEGKNDNLTNISENCVSEEWIKVDSNNNFNDSCLKNKCRNDNLVLVKTNEVFINSKGDSDSEVSSLGGLTTKDDSFYLGKNINENESDYKKSINTDSKSINSEDLSSFSLESFNFENQKSQEEINSFSSDERVKEGKKNRSLKSKISLIFNKWSCF